MVKKILVLAALSTALVAISAQMASAEWYHEKKALKKGENPTLKLEGRFEALSPNGSIQCSKGVFGFLELTGGTTDGHLFEFNVNSPPQCEITGGLVFLSGGTTTLKSMEFTGKATAVNIEEKQISLTGISLHLNFTNGFKLTLSSVGGTPLTAIPVFTDKIAQVILGGPLSSALGQMNIGGALTALAAAYETYGVSK